MRGELPSNITALVLNAVIATRTHGHGHVSTHVRWLYNLIRVSNAPAVFLFGVPSTRAVLQIAEGLPRLVVCWLLALGDLVLSQRGTSEHTVKQACLSSCCIVRGSPSSKVFFDQTELSWK